MMKKKIAGIALAILLCSYASLSFASTKTSADFTDLKDLDAATKAKFDAMISAGIFDGVSDTSFGLKEEMNRAQFAKVASLVMALKTDDSLKTSSFKDVKADDAANGYALPYIEALKAAGVTEGYGAGVYDPAGKVTKEQLATFLVRVLGKDADAKAKDGTDTTVSDWAQGYVALALELKLLNNGDDGKFGGKTNATRDLLLTGSYETKQQYVPPTPSPTPTPTPVYTSPPVNTEQPSVSPSDDTSGENGSENGGDNGGEQPGDGSGEQPGDGSGEQPGDGSGEQPGDGSGEQPGDGSGEQPGDGSGEQPGDGSGEQPCDGSGEQPGDGSGEIPGSGNGDDLPITDPTGGCQAIGCEVIIPPGWGG
ncbi:S-layer homology domain-containing protein [Paenibacillus catalpae]|uniref:S-layer homology domain-containing protein n=1 Tax=Paenibacillus catalpae TaxID=1045775 RepID=A0A1I2DJC8_9BACL|nr:S-layer homology domain-containing protein [Paenibacillus catalpae]SFE80411.1 S-layer homology domain-containing protein [Paenibacillus catalpae]